MKRQRHDPTHGRIDFDIQDHVDRMQEADGVIYPIAQRCAIENTLQNQRDRGLQEPFVGERQKLTADQRRVYVQMWLADVRAWEPKWLDRRRWLRATQPAEAKPHRHVVARHRHPLWHGHCAHNFRAPLFARQGWPWQKRCDRWHWHLWWVHTHG